MVYRRPECSKVEDLDNFQKIVRAAFAQRRKTLRNNLKSLLDEQQIQSLSIDPGRRGETLSIEEFAALSNLYTED